MGKGAFLTVLIAGLLLIASTPLSSAYKGHQLSRAEVLDFTLIDQHNENFTFSQSISEVHVVAFIFTRCIDVCPVITQSLKLVQNGLSESDAKEVQFISISVDPRYDTPERLVEFTGLHGVEWPHLTGDSETLANVYNSFGVIVQEDVIEAHVANSESTVTYVDTSGNASELMFEPTGWTLNEIIAEEANWTINATFGQFGHMMKAINGVESSDDWYWSLKIFNTSSMAWEESMLGIDSIDALENEHLAWAASNANASVLAPAPLNESNASIQILYPDNTTDNHSLQTDFNGYHLAKGAFAGAGMNASFSIGESGYLLDAIDDVISPSDKSWHWSMYTWNTSIPGWEVSTISADDLIEPGYIAWAPNTTNISEIPIPETLQPKNEMAPIVCGGNGWEMGSGEGKHCMCDEGYEWAEDDRLLCISNGEAEIDFSVGHSTITYIMDGMKPKIAWTGDSWKAADFRADLEEVISSQSSSSNSGAALPGMTLLAAVSGISFAAVIVHIRSSDEDDEA